MNKESKKFQKTFAWEDFKKLSRLQKLSLLDKNKERLASEQDKDNIKDKE